MSAPPSAEFCETVCIFRYEQPRSLQLKLTPKRALINVADCAFSAVYNNNMAANREETSLRAQSCTSQRELQRKPPASAFPDECLCCVKDKSKPGSPARRGRIGFHLYVCVSDPPGRISDWEQQGGNNRLSSSRPTLKWVKPAVAHSSSRLHV